MSLLNRLVAAFALTICTSASASAALIDFNNYSGSPNNGTVLGTISTDGYNFSSSHGHVINNVLVCNSTCADNGSQYLGGDMRNLLIDMGGAEFSVKSFDFAEAFGIFETPTKLTVEAFFIGGSTSIQIFSFDGIYDGAGALSDFQNLSVNLSNLSSLRLSADGFFSVDNIENELAVQVPEPALLSLFALGMAGLSLSRRRK